MTEQLLHKLLTKKQPAPTTMLTFRVSPELLAKIEAISERVSKPRSKVIKLVLEQGIDDLNKTLTDIDEVTEALQDHPPAYNEDIERHERIIEEEPA